MSVLIFFSIFFISFIPRFLFLTFSKLADPGWSPHWNLATGLLHYRTFGYHGERVTDIEPGYAFSLAAARWITHDHLFAVLSIEIALAYLGAIVLNQFTLLLSQNKKGAWISVLFYAFYPYFIAQSIAIIEVPIFTTALIACAFFYVRAVKKQGLLSDVACGLIFGVTVLVRSMILPALFLSLLALLWQKKLRSFFLIFFISFLVCFPWLLRSHHIDGSWIPPRSGWNLLQGNCIYSDKIIPAYNPDLLDAYVSQLLDQERPELADVERETLGKEVDDYFTMKAYAFIKANPWRTFKLKIKNIFYLFCPKIVPFYSMDDRTRIRFLGREQFQITGIPKRGVLREASHFVTYSFLLIAGICGMYQRRRFWRDDLIFYFILLTFTAVYSLYWPATRLRTPLDFIFMFYAAVFLGNFRRPLNPQPKCFQA